MTCLAFSTLTPLAPKSISRLHRHRLPPVTPSRSTTANRAIRPPTVATSVDYDGSQFDQFANRDFGLDAELLAARALPHRHRHTHIFLHPSSNPAFRPAASRFITSIRTGSTNSNPRLWILRAIADPYFGVLRGEPFPPRCFVLTTLREDDPDPFGVARWVAALDRAGKVLSPMDTHYVDWARTHICVSDAFVGVPMQPGWLIGSEILNANWSRSSTITGMRNLLAQHADHVISDGCAESFEVFQSIDSVTCFKSIEVYKSMDHLKHYYDTLDAPFAEEMSQHRAAVNRVRQLYECWECL